VITILLLRAGRAVLARGPEHGGQMGRRVLPTISACADSESVPARTLVPRLSRRRLTALLVRCTVPTILRALVDVPRHDGISASERAAGRL